MTPHQVTHEPPVARPSYFLQDDNNNKPTHWYNTRLQMSSIMQEAMLACIYITKLTFEISAAKLATQKFPLKWFCKMANYISADKANCLSTTT